ncbi:MAG: acetate uptake transporter [Coriobacteriia bacterium]|nr:acetate uptake transporter [Coriobacteriia bacterium]
MSNGETNVKMVLADGSSLGLFSLGLATLIGSSALFGSKGVGGDAWVLCVAAFAQIWAAGMAFKSNNVLGGTAFGAYGLFWLGLGMSDILASGLFGSTLATANSTTTLFYASIGFCVFSIFLTIAAVKANKLLVIVIGLIAVLFFGLVLQTSGSGAATAGQHIADYARIILAVVAFYGAGALILNAMFERTILPIGAPKA